MSAAEALLVRHAQTEWSLSGQHTGRTDLPLTEDGRRVAATLAPLLASESFAAVLCSPLARARETCMLAGFGERAELRDDLMEWDYGDYEGLTSAQIHARSPDWNLWRDGCPGGEQPADVGARAARVVAEIAGTPGTVAVFSHGHMLRVLGATWVELGPAAGARLALAPAARCRLGREHGLAVLEAWNLTAEDR